MNTNLFGMLDTIFMPEQLRIAFPDAQTAPKKKSSKKTFKIMYPAQSFTPSSNFISVCLPGVENGGFPIL